MVDATFKFYLQKTPTSYYTVDGGAVVLTATKTELRNDPDGWRDLTMQYARNETYWGIFRMYALDLRFVLDGAKILRHVFFTEGYEGECILYIEKRNTIDGSYSFWSSGELDFSQINIEDDFVSTSILQRGLPEFFANKKDLTFEIPLDVSAAKLIRLDGIKIRGTINWTIVSYVAPGSLVLPRLTMLYRTSEIGKRYVPDDVNQQSNFDYTDDGSTADLVTRFSNNYFFKATTTDPIKIRYGQYRITFNQSPIISQKLFILVTDTTGAYVETILLQTQDATQITRSTIGEITINPTIGYKYSLVLGGDPGWQEPGSSTYFQISDFNQDLKATFEIDYVIRLPVTGTKGLRYIDFAKALVEKASDGQYSVVSDFLSNTATTASARRLNIDSSPFWLMITSAQAIRGFTDPVAKASIAEMCQDLWSRYMLAVSVDGNNLRIEPLSYYFKNSEAYRIEDLSDMLISPYNEKIFNSFKIGYPDNTYDELSGLDEFNTTHQYSLDAVTRINKEDDVLAPFRSDMYGIEWLRNKRNTIAAQDQWAKTKDSSSDNDTFAIEIDPVQDPRFSSHPLYRPVGFIDGLTDPDTAYNIVQSPHRMLRRHMPRLRSITYSKGNVVYQTSDKNPRLVSNFFAGTTYETHDESLSVNPWPEVPINPLFLPVVFEFTTVPPYDLVALLDADPNRYITFVYKGVELKGYILDVGVIPATRDKRTYRVLSHPDNNLENLI